MTNSAPRILIIRFSSIGDIVLTTPVVRCLKRQLGAEIHYLTKRAYQSLLDHNPFIDHIHTLESTLQKTLAQLKAHSFDYVIDLHSNLRSWRLRLQLGGRHRAFHKINLAKWLKVNLKMDFLPNTHIVDRYLATVTYLGVHNDGEGLDAFYPQDLPSPIAFDDYIVLAIGAAHATKRLPLHKLIELCTQLRTQVVLIGGPTDQGTAAEIEKACPKAKNLVGKISLTESTQIIDRAKLVITHDTGMMHIAAALQKPIISIWGNTIPTFGMYPYYPRQHNIANRIFEVEGLSCRPCSKIGFDKCPKGHFRCMENQDMAAVVDQVDSLHP